MQTMCVKAHMKRTYYKLESDILSVFVIMFDRNLPHADAFFRALLSPTCLNVISKRCCGECLETWLSAAAGAVGSRRSLQQCCEPRASCALLHRARGRIVAMKTTRTLPRMRRAAITKAAAAVLARCGCSILLRVCRPPTSRRFPMTLRT